MKSEPDPPMTLGGAAAAQLRFIVWRRECRIVGARNATTKSNPDPAEMATRYGAETPLLDWRERLVCSRCGSRRVDMVVSGAGSASEMRPQPVTAAAPRPLQWPVSGGISGKLRRDFSHLCILVNPQWQADHEYVAYFAHQENHPSRPRTPPG